MSLPLVWAVTIFVVTMIKELNTLHTSTCVSDDHYFGNLLSRAKFNHLLLFNISYQLPHDWIILIAFMSRSSSLDSPNFKRSEKRGHLRPLNSHFQMLICVIIQFVLLFDKVLAFCQYFSNVQMRHRQINIIIVVKNFGVEVSCHKLGEDVIAYFEAYLPSGNKCGQQKPITGENSWKDF